MPAITSPPAESCGRQARRLDAPERVAQVVGQAENLVELAGHVDLGDGRHVRVCVR